MKPASRKLKPCFICGEKCEVKEYSLDLIRCSDCSDEESLKDEDRFEHIRERENRERIV